ncbi:MAG: hypothetical protein ACXU86_23975, partial [Archangium sp.]
MRSPRPLLGKDLRELLGSRPYLLFLLLLGPLVGQAFISAVEQYAEASGLGGGPAALAQGLSPLDGILVPTFGAYDLAATLLFPFVVIRLVSAEKSNGALALLLQAPPGLGLQLASKALALLLGWVLAWVPGLAAVALWGFYGGHVHGPELLNLLLGHLLRGLLTLGIAISAAALAEGPANAAILTLAFTLGTWALDLLAAGRGGWLQQLAAYTPTAALRVFEQGELRASLLVGCFALGLGGLALAGVWLHPGHGWRRRGRDSLVLLLVLAAALGLASRLRGAWDVSENRRHSFSAADETALRGIREPLRISVHLAPEDPRLLDLERGVLDKLRRVMPELEVSYTARSHSGLFEEEGYGEIWYALGARRVMIRSLTEPI